jgi:mono/diheme cytochrome c family protein
MSRTSVFWFSVALLACHREPNPPTMPAQPVTAEPTPSPEARAAQLARGDYIAAIAGCTTCHGKDLSGAGKTPNISPDPKTGIGSWSDTQIIAAIRQGVRPDGARLVPLMPYPYYNRMTDADAQALVAYIKAQPPVQQEFTRPESKMQPIAMTAPTGNVDRVEDLRAHGEYLASLMHCGACHTPQQGPYANQALAGGTRFPQPDGSFLVAPNITQDRDTGIGSWDDKDIVRAVREMKDPTGQDLAAPMSFYKDAWSRLSDPDANALVTFIRSVPAVHHDVSTDQPPAVSQQP